MLLDEVDRELERRGHYFVRYADDANVYVRSQKAGERVMVLLKRLYETLHLSVNESKNAVTSAFGRKFLGYELWSARGDVKRAASYKAQKQFKQRIRWYTRRSCGRSLQQIVDELRLYILGWKAYFGLSQTPYDTDCELSSLNNGSAERRHIVSCEHLARVTKWRRTWQQTPAAGGITVVWI